MAKAKNDSRASPQPATATSPTTKLLYGGAAVVGGVLVLTLLSRKAPATTTITAAQAALLAKTGTVPAPTQSGITFRSGSIGGFIPIPFQQIFSGVASIFQPRPGQPAPTTALVTPPAAEQAGTLSISSLWGETIRPDGTVYTAPDQGISAGDVYGSVPIPEILREQGVSLPPIAEFGAPLESVPGPFSLVEEFTEWTL